MTQENASEEKEKQAAPDMPPELIAEIKRREVLARLEEEAEESALGRLCRSKNFWYAVFGVIFFVIMGALIAWAAKDLGYL
ncbi:MAG: hypothetical protein MJ106_00335 [Lentisphaeria bacterium]|nr:hypothetical protein [Lentisphaeria bacterium]